MTKTPRKTHNEIEHLRGEVKRLKAINRQLRKQLKLSKRKKIEPTKTKNEEEIITTSQQNLCQQCNRGQIESIDLKYIIIHNCNICGYTTVEKKGNNDGNEEKKHPG